MLHSLFAAFLALLQLNGGLMFPGPGLTATPPVVTLIQTATGSGTAGGSAWAAGSGTVSASSITNLAGDTLIVCGYYETAWAAAGSTGASVSDTEGNTYTQLVYFSAANQSGGGLACFAAHGIAGGSNVVTFTLTFTGGSYTNSTGWNDFVSVAEYSGMGTPALQNSAFSTWYGAGGNSGQTLSLTDSHSATASVSVSAPGTNSDLALIDLLVNGNDYLFLAGLANNSGLTVTSSYQAFHQELNPQPALSGANDLLYFHDQVVNLPASSVPSSGLWAWYRADCVTFNSSCYTPSNGASVSTVSDYSGGGHSISVAGGTAPTFATSQVNGLPALDFFGCRCTFTGPSAPSGYTAFVVMKNASTSRHDLISGSGGSQAFDWWFSATQGADNMNIVGLGHGTATLDATSWHQYNVTYTNNSTSLAFRYNRASDATVGATASNITSGSNIFADHGSDDTGINNGYVAEFLFYTRVLSGSEISQVETYLNGRFGI